MKRRTGNTNYNIRNKASADGSSVVSAFKEAESIAKNIFDLFDKGSESIITAFSSAFGFVQQMVSLAESIQSTSSVLDSIFSFLPGGGIIGSIFGGGRAEGGFVNAGVPYIIGEQGPEIFIPDVNGIVDAGNSAHLSSIQDLGGLTNNAAASGVSSAGSPNITVIVQSEVESSKAVKFFKNHFPDYENRRGKENFS